jgi:hypothetical protein
MSNAAELRLRLALCESAKKLRSILHAAEKLGNDDLVERAAAKIAKVMGRPPLGNMCPQIRMRVTEWVEDENGVLGREVYAEDVPTTI